MAKMLALLLAVAAAVAAVGAQNVLPYQLQLDPTFIVSWGLNDQENFTTVEVYAITPGWVSLTILSPQGNFLDVWWGGYDDEYDTGYLEDGNAAFVNLNVGPRYPDTVQDLFLIGTNQGMANTTRFRLRRRYETGDRNDVDILKGVTYTVIWSYAADDAPQSEAIRGGTASITFRPVA